jgi:hypothetical protein
MPRAMRVEYPGAFYHVMGRVDRREDIFINGKGSVRENVMFPRDAPCPGECAGCFWLVGGGVGPEQCDHLDGTAM